MLRQPFGRLHLHQAEIIHDLPAKPVQAILLPVLRQHRFGEAVFGHSQTGTQCGLLALQRLPLLLQQGLLRLGWLDLLRQRRQPALDHLLFRSLARHLFRQRRLLFV